MITNPEFDGFQQLVAAVKLGAATERFFRMDVRPSYADTPENWEDVLEGAFNGVLDER